jgi:hypothetical protein
MITFTGVIFAAQAGLVLLFAEKTRPAFVPVPGSLTFRRMVAPLDEEALSKYIFAGNPTIFPSASPLGFAEQAWLRLPRVEYNVQESEIEPPSFLEFASNPLGASASMPGPIQEQIPFDLVGKPGLSRQPAPVYPVAEGTRPESFFRIEGPLAERAISSHPPLRAWPAETVLSNTVVHFAVDHSGQVVSARLWAGSGLLEADASAVEAVNEMVFTPAGTSAAGLTWDWAVFYWRTIAPPPATNASANAVPEALPPP